MKTVLASLNAKYVHTNLAIRYLKAYCSEYDITLFESSINDNFSDSAFRIIDEKPDIVAFSCYIWNIEGTIKLCSIIKKVLPAVKILLGGPEVSFNGGHYLENYDFIDFIIAGEGEKALKAFLKCLSDGEKCYNEINGLVFRKDDEIIENGMADLIYEMDSIPFPYSENIPDKILYYEASRGCPFGCSYCLSGSAAKLRYFSLDRVKRDLAKLIENKVTLVKFVDRTFNANKAFCKELWSYLIQAGGNTRFHFEIALDLLDDTLLQLLKAAPKDLFQFEIGVQSTNDIVLDNINRRMDFNKIKANLIKIREGDNIHCHLDLIAGLPGENIESFKTSFEECMELMPDVLQLGFLKVLKGTKLYSQKEQYGIEAIPYPNYQVLYTADMRFEEIRYLMKFEKVFDTYYNSGIYSITLNYLLQHNKSFEFFEAFTEYLLKTDFFRRNIDHNEKFKYLYDFAVQSFMEETIRDIMLHDYIINTKKSVLPEFLKKDIDKSFKMNIKLNSEALILKIGTAEVKRICYFPVTIKVKQKVSYKSFERGDSTVVFNMDSGLYCYL